jgi:hypothetical protein
LDATALEAYAEDATDFPEAEAYAEVDAELYAMAAGSTSSIPMRAERIMIPLASPKALTSRKGPLTTNESERHVTRAA